MNKALENLDKWYDDEMEALDRDLQEGHISQAEYNTYFKNINAEYQDSLKEINDE